MSFRNSFKLLNSTTILLKSPKCNVINHQNYKCNGVLAAIVSKSHQIQFFSTQTPVNSKERSNNTVIYYGPLSPQIKKVKLFSFTTSAMGVAFQPVFYNAFANAGNTTLFIGGYSFIAFFTFFTPLLLHFITKKYVSQLEYNEKDDIYIAKTYNFFCMTKEIKFTADQVVVPDVPGMFTSVIANGKPLFFDLKQFNEPEHYGRLMGYNKPIDLKLGKQPTKQE